MRLDWNECHFPELTGWCVASSPAVAAPHHPRVGPTPPGVPVPWDGRQTAAPCWDKEHAALRGRQLLSLVFTTQSASNPGCPSTTWAPSVPPTLTPTPPTHPRLTDQRLDGRIEHMIQSWPLIGPLLCCPTTSTSPPTFVLSSPVSSCDCDLVSVCCDAPPPYPAPSPCQRIASRISSIRDHDNWTKTCCWDGVCVRHACVRACVCQKQLRFRGQCEAALLDRWSLNESIPLVRWVVENHRRQSIFTFQLCVVISVSNVSCALSTSITAIWQPEERS